MNATSVLREFRAKLRRGELIVAPGAIDGITAKLIEHAGFSAAYMTGAGTSATLGYPDYGLLTMTEMVSNAARIVNASGLPLISDADTGYGNELNVFRTVQEFERVGVAAIHIEDQTFPKRCGHLDNKEVIDLQDYIAKIRSAVAAKRSPDFCIIARTDSRAVNGLKDAINRANAALANGADIAFVEAPQSIEELEEIPRSVDGPCLLNMVGGGKTPLVTFEQASYMGYSIAILPGLLLRGIISTCDQLLSEVNRLGRYPDTDLSTSPHNTFSRFGAAEWDQRRTAFR